MIDVKRKARFLAVYFEPSPVEGEYRIFDWMAEESLEEIIENYRKTGKVEYTSKHFDKTMSRETTNENGPISKFKIWKTDGIIWGEKR